MEGWQRRKAALIVGLAAALLAVPLAPALHLPHLQEAAPAPAAPAGAGTAWWHTWSRAGAHPGIDAAIPRIETDGLAAAAPDGTLRYAVAQRPDGLRYDVFVRYDREPDASDVAALAAALAIAPETLRVYPLAEAIHARGLPYALIERAITVPGVVAVELERSVQPLLDIAAATALVVPHANLGDGARERWRVTGRHTVIAVLDTGIDKAHEAIHVEHYLGGYDATIPTGRIGDELLPNPPEPLPNGTWTPLNEEDPHDDWRGGHGTHVAGIALGQDPNGTYIGMAPDAKFLDVKVFASPPTNDSAFPEGLGLGPDGASMLPYGWGSYVLEGLEFVKRYNRGESHLGDPREDRIDIALLALGESEPDANGDSVLSHATNRLVDTGVVAVAAAGNCGRLASDCPHAGDEDTIVAPGAARQAITVGSLDHHGTVDLQDETISNTSSRGPNGGEPKPNLVAYGEPITAPESVRSADGAKNGYHAKRGTSMAAAQIAGIAALLLEVAPELAPHDVKAILMATARDKGPPGWDATYGAGAVNALFAVGVAFGALSVETTNIDANGQDMDDQPPPRQEPKANESVRVNRAPVARFRYQPQAPMVGDSLVFIDASSDPEGEAIVAYNWDFGDGDTGKGPRAAHSYARAGSYRVVLTATDLHGAAGSWDVALDVAPAPGDTRESAGPGLALLLAAGLAAAAYAALRARPRRGPECPDARCRDPSMGSI